MDYTDLNYQISRLEDLASDAEAGRQQWKDVWSLIKEIGGNFKQTRFPSKSDKDEAWRKFQETVIHVKEVQQGQRQENERRAAGLISRLKDLEDLVEDAKRRSVSWKEVWSEIKDISEAFKQTRFPDREEREAAWNRLQRTVKNVKSYQADEHRERENRASESAQFRERILSAAYSARPLSGLEQAVGDLIFGMLELTVEVMSLGLLKNELDNRKEELKVCSQRIKEAWELFHDHKGQMLGRDKHEAFETLRKIQDEINAAWDEWRGAQQKFHEMRQSAHRERVEANIEKLENRLENLYGILSKREGHLSELEDKRDSARSDDFRDRVEGWIDEEEDRISSIRGQISQVEGWLDEERRKL